MQALTSILLSDKTPLTFGSYDVIGQVTVHSGWEQEDCGFDCRLQPVGAPVGCLLVNPVWSLYVQ